MKQHILKSFAEHFFALIVLFISSLAIWFMGPLLYIANQYPLHQAEKRGYVIAFLVLVWALKLIFTSPSKKQAIPVTRPVAPEAQRKIQILQGRFQGAIRFLKKTSINKQDKSLSLAHLPWYLLIGPGGTGKSTLLANANVNFILTKQFKQEMITASDSCDWWVTRDLVIVDVPGNYLIEKNQYLWKNFLNLIKKDRSKTTLKAVVIALPLPELIRQQNPKNKKQLIADFKQKISQLREQFGQQLTFYFLITKCDQLPGFIEFFSESSAEELTQAWGITLPTLKENEKLLDIFIPRFNSLIKRLNNQLIWRLHQERNPNVRPAIKDFPLQIERLKDALGNFLKGLNIPDLRLHGVYLTSAMQSPAEDLHQPQVINPGTQAMQLLRTPSIPSKAYFIRQLLLQGLLTNGDIHQPQEVMKKSRWHRRLAFAAAICTVIITTVFLARDFQNGVLLTYAIQNHLAQYQLSIQQDGPQDEHLLKALPLLNSLQSASTHTNNNLSRLATLLSFYSDKSQQTATDVYQQALQTIVLPEIKNAFESYLKHSDDKNPVQTYAVLKAYLMLGSQKNMQIDYVVSNFKNILPNALNKKINDPLISHIRAAFIQAPESMPLNNDLIKSVRSKLTSMSNQELAFVILKNMNNNIADSPISFSNNLNASPSFVSKQVVTQVPNMFTANAFATVLSQQLSVAATESLQGNEVIGNSDILPNEASIVALTDQVRVRYITNYADIWESMLANIKLETPKNLAQTDALISTFMSNTSPLLNILQTIKQNTAFAPILTVSPKIQALNTLLANANNNEENTLYQIFVSLRQLHFHLQKILGANDVGAAAFEASKTRMQNSINDPILQLHLLAEKSPEPMRTWLNNISTESWRFILQEASNHIERAWQVNVNSIYQSQIAHRAPISKTAEQEIDIQQFLNLIGKQGALANYYQHYLKPFVDDSGKQWQWRVVDNQKLPISRSVLDQIQEATKLQNISKYALFTKGRQNPAVQRFRLPETLIEKA